MTYVEAFVQSYARTCVDRMVVMIDKESGDVLITFGDRNTRLSLGDVLLKEEAFRRLGRAVENLLGVSGLTEEGVTDEA
jgi:hypothetical protein